MEYRAGRGPPPDDPQIPDRPIHRAGGLHFAEGDHHLTPEERAAMEQGKLRGEPPVGPDGQPIGLNGEQIHGEELEMGPVDQSNQRGQRPLIDTDAKLRERLSAAERDAKKSADEKYRALKDIEEEVRRERAHRGDDVDAPLHFEGDRDDEAKSRKKEKSNGKGKEEKQPSHEEDREEEEEERPTVEKVKSVGGRKKVPLEPAEPTNDTPATHADAAEKAPQPDPEDDDAAGGPTKKTPAEKDHAREEDRETGRVRAVLASILAKSPVTIFSKTYCPFSLKAKHILRDAYTVTPAPHVVELNEHADGAALQQLLQKTTGRRTVPNVLVNGKSIGGGDEMEKLWRNRELPARIQQMAGKRVESVAVNFAVGQDPVG